MTFEQLLYVEVLSHYSSMQKAADVLHISKPGLSLAISQLEDELNMKIFERTSRGTTVTEAGLQLLSTISQILQSKANLEKLASFSSGSDRKTIIRIRYINTIAKAFINQFVNRYDEKYGNVFYDISRADTKTIIQLVRHGEINAGFIASSHIESEWIKDLIFKPVCYGKAVLAVSKSSNLLNKAITFEDLKEQKFCIYDDVYHELLFDRLQYLCGPLNLILKTDDHWAIMEAVTKLNAVCIGRSQQAVLSREIPIPGYVTLDIGHLINDDTSLRAMDFNAIKAAVDGSFCRGPEILNDVPYFIFFQNMKGIIDPGHFHVGRHSGTSSQRAGVVGLAPRVAELQNGFVPVLFQCRGDLCQAGDEFVIIDCQLLMLRPGAGGASVQAHVCVLHDDHARRL